MKIKAQIIQWGKGGLGGFASLLSVTGAAIVFVFTQSSLLSKVTTAVVGIAALGLFLSSRFLTGDLSITCVQSQSSAQDQHYKQYRVTDGYGEIEVFVDIPRWMSEFEIKIEVSDPFKLSAWEHPKPVIFKEDRLICRDELNDFDFVLTVGGDTDKLKETSYVLRFVNEDSGKTIERINIITEHGS